MMIFRFEGKKEAMICLRCGHCCHNIPKVLLSIVTYTGSKNKEPESLNVIDAGETIERCPHLRGDRPGEYFCIIHDRSWYKETPCYSHGQIERSPADKCRVGQNILNTANANYNDKDT
jgi:hypothetical protein